MLNNLPVLAQAQAAGQQPGALESIISMGVPVVLFGVIFYFLLIRPQMKESKKREAMLGAIKSGDKVVTAGGIYGVVTNVKENSFIVRIADNVKVEVSKPGVVSVVEEDVKDKEEKK